MRITYALVAVSACLVSVSVNGQEAGRAGIAAPAAGGVLEEVTVTARRREENLQSVPAAVSVLGGEWLDSSFTVNPQQVAQLVPSLYYNSANPRNTAYTIRGLGSNTLSISAANDGIEPGVGFYVDQVYHGRPATASFDFTDVERVEILRGPQGTLFGKNTTAGAIHVISREPTFDTEVNGEVSIGNYDYHQFKGSLSGGITDTLAARISAQSTERNGNIYNVRTDESLNNLNNTAVRGQLLWKPSDSLKLRLIGDVSDLDAACCTQNFLRVGTSRRAANRQFPGLAAGLGYSPPSRDIFDRLTDIDARLHVDTQDGGFSLIADWDVAPGTFTSVSAWRWWDWDVSNDRDYTGVPIQLIQRIPSRQDQYSEELRFASKADGPLSYVGGLYFFRQRIKGRPTSVYGPEAAYWLLNPANFTVAIPRNLLDGYGQYGTSYFDMSSYAAFGEINYAITRRLTATLGLRYTYEDKDGAYATTVSGGGSLAGLPAATVTALNNAKLTIFRPQSYVAADSDGSLSGRANVSYQLTDALFGYVSYADGYKSGGLNMSGLPLDAQNRPTLATAVIRDERNKTVEVGMKSTLFGGRAIANLAAYRTVVTDYQANIVSSLETAAIRSYPSNIPEVRVQGAELDMSAVLLEGLTVRASGAFADGKNTDYPLGPCPLEVQTAATVACNLTGTRLSGLSRWSGSLGVDYRVAAGRGTLVLHTDTTWRSGYNSDTSSSIYTAIGGFSLTNASVGYLIDDKWELGVFARNVFDKDYVTALTIQTGNSGLILGQPSDPRLYGFTVRARL